VQAYRANALLDAHCDDPEFGYRYLVEEARAAGEPMAERTAWRICSQHRLWSAFGKTRRGKNGRTGPPVHDDLVERDFTADALNQLWLSDITEHRTGEGKLYVCAIKDVFSNRIVGYSIDSRMKSRLATTALHSAIARRGQVPGCIVHTDRGSQFRSRKPKLSPDRAADPPDKSVFAWCPEWRTCTRSAGPAVRRGRRPSPGAPPTGSCPIGPVRSPRAGSH
jgi:hypothetical protein